MLYWYTLYSILTYLLFLASIILYLATSQRKLISQVCVLLIVLISTSALDITVHKKHSLIWITWKFKTELLKRWRDKLYHFPSCVRTWPINWSANVGCIQRLKVIRKLATAVLSAAVLGLLHCGGDVRLIFGGGGLLICGTIRTCRL